MIVNFITLFTGITQYSEKLPVSFMYERLANKAASLVGMSNGNEKGDALTVAEKKLGGGKGCCHSALA